MNTHRLYCVGHITLDRVVTPKSAVYMPGGTSFYFSHAIKHFGSTDYTLVTALVESRMRTVEELRTEGTDIAMIPSKYTAYFENIYGEGQNSHTQRVLAKVDPFTVEYLESINSKIFHLDGLLVDDFSLEVVRCLTGKSLVSIDSRGYLREVRDKGIFATGWPEKKEVLKYVHFLRANEHKMKVLAGYTDAVDAGKAIHDQGAKEASLTFGSMGSIICDGSTFHKIPTYIPKEVVNATGAGDTYMTGYLYKRAEGASIEEAGYFAAAMTALKVEGISPLNGTKENVLRCLETTRQRMLE